MAESVIQYRYKLCEELGRNPFWVTWRAQDRLLDRPVVLKILSGGDDVLTPGGGKGGAEAFVAAMGAAESVTAQGWVRVLEIHGDEGRPFWVREFVAGTSLRWKIRNQAPLPWQEAVNILLLLGQMVADLHQKGWVHGHLHPDNIFISRQGRLKVTDIGQANAWAYAYGAGGSWWGDPVYTPPKQLGGGGPQVGSDLYGLGVVWHELLTGEPPSPGPSPTSARVGQGSGGPPELARLTMKMLQRAPDSRYASADELCQDLKRLQERSLERVFRTSRGSAGETRGREAGGPGEKPADDHLEPGGGPRVTPLGWRIVRGLIRFLVVIMGVLLATGICLGLVGYGAYRYWESTIPPEVVVPEVVGQPLEEAQSQMEAWGLRLLVVAEQASNRIPKDHVLRTTPKGGRTVREGRQIRAVVSTGKGILSVPDVVNQEVARAREILKQAGLQVGVEQGRFDDLIPPNYVISQSPPAGSRLEKGGEVNLVVSQREGSGEGDEGLKEAVKEEVHAGRVRIRVPAQPRLQQVRIVVRDSRGEHTVYDQLHVAGEVISEAISGTGETLIEVYLNGRLVQSKTL